jgi:predicted Zn-dependent protease
LAATLAAIALGSQSAEMGQAALMAIQAGAVQFQINFTRAHEEEADRVGMETLQKSDYNPRSMPTFFERLQQSSRYAGLGVPEFLRTHPVTASRISDTRGRAENYPYKQYPDSMAYQLTKAKVRVITAIDRNEPFKYFASRLKQGTTEQRTVARYGLGLSLIYLQKYKDADIVLQALVNEYPNQIQYASALARSALDSRNFNLALKRYKNLIERFPGNEAVKLEYIGTLINLGDIKQAQQTLAALRPETKKLPIYFELLALVYSKLKQPAEYHRYLAEYYYLTGRTRDAIVQIKLARNSKGLNEQLAYILNERLNFFLLQMEQARQNK